MLHGHPCYGKPTAGAVSGGGTPKLGVHFDLAQSCFDRKLLLRSCLENWLYSHRDEKLMYKSVSIELSAGILFGGLAITSRIPDDWPLLVMQG